jgi:hypothetical protein
MAYARKPMITAQIKVSAASDVAAFLERTIPTMCPLPNVADWEEVRDALFALANDTDAIVTEMSELTP